MNQDDVPPARPIRPCVLLDGRTRAPASKSLTIRALAAAALAPGRSVLKDPLLADDTRLMARALGQLGIPVLHRGDSFIVEGPGGRLPAGNASLWLDNAGTPLRILTALCTLGDGRITLDGSARMRERPIAGLVTALRDLDVRIRSIHDDGCPPVEVLAGGFPGGTVLLQAGASSQYLSALLMVAPCGSRALELEVAGKVVSRPYIDLTVQVMREFGARIDHEGHRRFLVHPTGYHPRQYAIEADASSASYFFAAAAITGGRVEVTGIPPESRQGDLRFLDLLEEMGCRTSREAGTIRVEGCRRLKGIDAELGDTPDLVPSLAAVALFAHGKTTIRGIAHLRLKETDRIETVASCVRALGARADTGPDSLTIRPLGARRRGPDPVTVDPAGDHRLAMAFAVAGLALPGLRIADPDCVSKSFPDFFERLEQLTA
ncbi:MAG: 3-phosphoshikimate 1-carboxyvinyltransferase [Acidobacteriota bacterium]